MKDIMEQKATKRTKAMVGRMFRPSRVRLCAKPSWLAYASCPSLFSAIIFFLLWFSAASAVGTAETPRRGGTLRLAFITDWRTLDPAIAYDADAAPLDKLLFRGLLDYGTGNDLVPDHASDWNVSPDGKTYLFHLRPGVKFSHGREVEAEDYVFSLERIINPKSESPGQSLVLDIAGATEFAKGQVPHVIGLRAPDSRTLPPTPRLFDC